MHTHCHGVYLKRSSIESEIVGDPTDHAITSLNWYTHLICTLTEPSQARLLWSSMNGPPRLFERATPGHLAE